MGQVPRVTYGPGGFDPNKPNANVVDSGTITMPDPPADLGPALATIRNKVTGQGAQPTDTQLVAALATAFHRVLVQNNPVS